MDKDIISWIMKNYILTTLFIILAFSFFILAYFFPGQMAIVFFILVVSLFLLFVG